ncbi:hypothetical protein K4F52_001194 [Lecanicillium sp. MT-2017a]|nr:hypothetical protein K4F52_001194 [Lecanicillium sp. MT-2017a]
MPASRFQHSAARLHPSSLRATLRSLRSKNHHMRAILPQHSDETTTRRASANTINSIIYRQPSIVGLVQERDSFPTELGVLEPRPVVYWSSVEERMGSLVA